MTNTTPGGEGDSVPNGVHRVHLTEEKETLLITLYAKALDSRSRNPILGDEKAYEIVRMIDYDFERLNNFGNGNVIVARARTVDEWTREFLGSNPGAVVLNLGCGLDTRVSRIDPSPGVSWFDVDYPEVIGERRNFYSDRVGYRMIGSSVTEPGWLREIPEDRPTLVIAEGVFEYLTEEQVKALLNRVTGRFSRGEAVFDVMNSFAERSGRSSLMATTGAEHRWAVDDVRRVDGLDPKLRRTASLSVLGSRYLPPRYRLLYGIVGLFPSFRNMMRLLRYEF